MRRITACLLVLVAFWSVSVQASDWLRFRGPNGSGVSPDQAEIPTTWSDAENLKWKAELPGPGSSSPIVVGDRVLVTCWSGYGLDKNNPGDQQKLKLHLLCFNRDTGAMLWNQEVAPKLPEEEYRGMFAEHGYASHTPVSDGQRVYAYFGRTGVVAFDVEGNKLWQTEVGDGFDSRSWGSSSSPILYKNLVIATASIESQALVALNKDTGEEIWRQEAAGFSSTWGTPVLVEVDVERTDLVLAVPYEIWALNPENGKLRWYCESFPSDSMCSSAVTQDGIIYAMETGPRGGGAAAVRAGGKGDVTETHVVWKGRERSRIGTPVYYAGRIYWISSGIANCIDAKTGESVYQARLTSPAGATPAAGPSGGRGRGGMGGSDYSSPVVAGSKMVFVRRSGETYVLELGTEFKQVACNRFASDNSDFSSTPAVSDGQLFIRSSQNLYCVAQPE